MKTFNVLLYCNALASKLVDDVEADTAEEACRIAIEEDDGDGYEDGDLGESWVGSIVDADGENVDVPPEYREATGDAAGKMLAALKAIAETLDPLTRAGAFDALAVDMHPDKINAACDAVSTAIAAAEAAGITAEG